MLEYTKVQLPNKIFFNYDIEEFDSSLKNVVNPFYQLAEKELYEWESTEFQLPSSIFTGLNVKKFDLGIKDYLNIDECRGLAKDSNGQPKALTKLQLNDMRHFGVFKVQSLQFPDKHHVWRIHCLLQKGTKKICNDFRRDLLRVVNIFLITARNRIVSEHNSIRSCGGHIWRGIYLLIDLIFGVPHNNPGNIDTKMEEECLQFLTCELSVSKEDQQHLCQFWDFMEQLSCLPNHYGAERLKEYFPIYNEESNIPFGIYQFLTPDQLIIDFRLANRTLKLKCLDIVKEAVKELEDSDWFIDYRRNYIEKISDNCTPLKVIEKDLNKQGLKAKLNKLSELIQVKCKNNDIPDSICETMIDNAKYFLICSEVESRLEEKWLAERNDISERLYRSYPFRSQTSLWMRKQLKKARQQFILQHEFEKLKWVIERCTLEGLKQHEYFAKRYLLFMKERKPLIENQLNSNSSFPNRQYNFKSRMILSKYWKVSPTIDNDGKRIYEVDKWKTLRWTSRYPGWRWVNYFLHTYMMMLTIGQFLLITVPFKTPVSYLSLFCLKPFSTKYNFEPKTGTISSAEADLATTLVSRLVTLWNHVWDCRNKFENKPFHGLLDKSVARHFHRLWVVVLQGGVGTIGIVVIMPVLCVVFSTVCCLLGVLVPLWVPFVTSFMYLGAVFIYDFQKADYQENRFFCFFQATLWHILFCGIGQLFLISLVLILILPLLAFTLLVWAIIRISFRYIWDTFMFYLILKRYAHVPATNDFVAKRIAGPGLAYDYEILVRPEHVLLGFRCFLEREELDLWLQQVTAIIKEPLVKYSSFINQTLEPLAVSINMAHEKIKKLLLTEQESLRRVYDLYNERMEMLNIKPFTTSDKEGKLHLSSKNLQIVLEKGEMLCRSFYNDNLKEIIKSIYVDEMEWWNKRNVKIGDFKNYAINSLSYLFGEQILSSIEDCDEIFHLEVNDLTLSAYMTMFVSETYADDSDEKIIDSYNNSKDMSPEHLQIKLRNFVLSHIPATNFFGFENENFPTALKSFPYFNKKTKSRRYIFKNFKDWMKCCANYYDSVASDDSPSSLIGSHEPWRLNFYHPLIICTLLHSRDRDNSMLDHDHIAVSEGIERCYQLKYSPTFLDRAVMTQSIDYSMSSLDNLSCQLK